MDTLKLFSITYNIPGERDKCTYLAVGKDIRFIIENSILDNDATDIVCTEITEVDGHKIIVS